MGRYLGDTDDRLAFLGVGVETLHPPALKHEKHER